MSAVLQRPDIDEPVQAASNTWPNEALRQFPWVEEPRKSAPGLDDLLAWAHQQGASRVDIKTGHRATIKVHGSAQYATREAQSSLELKSIVDHVYSADGTARVMIGEQLDTAYSVMLNRRESLRFRLNICPITTMRGQGVQIIMRPIPSRPPSLDVQRVEPEIRATNRIRSGIKLFGGATGSGKTSLQFGLAEARLLDPYTTCDMASGEEPIEYLLDYLRPSNGNRISQTEMRPPAMTFGKFVRGCMRREMTDIIIGECRDGDTMDAAVNCGITGGSLATTIHADTCSLMIQRTVALCPRAERDNLTSAFAQALRFLINQRLLPRVGGGRVAIREFLTLDRALRRRMLQSDPETWPDLIDQAISVDGQSFARAIDRALADGVITEETALDAQRRDA